MTVLEIKLLGEFEVRDSLGHSVTVAARKNRAMLALLALAPSGGLSRDRIAGLLWSDRDDSQAGSSLR